MSNEPVREREELIASLSTIHAQSYGWALACCRRDANDALDVLQAAYEKVLAGKARFGGNSSPRTWFFSVIRLTANENARRSVFRRLLPARMLDLGHAPASAPGPDGSLERERMAVALAEALAKLSARQREVIHLVFYEELTLEEASAVMGVAIGTARIHYDRGKKALGTLLGAQKEVP